jgi:hypothetical protein
LRNEVIKLWKKVSLPQWSVPIALFILCVISFGLLIPSLGFYLDDWYTIWFAKTLGIPAFRAIYAEDRPFLAYFYIAATTLVGQTPIAWQIFNLFCRWLAGLAVWWMLRQLWPRACWSIALVAFVFVVYPGFKQNWIAVSFSPWYLFLALYLFSVGGMILSIRKPKWFWPLMLISLLASVYELFSTEYYFGLELLRPVFLWIILSPLTSSSRERLRKTFLYWFPYLGGLLAFWIWRTFFFVSTHYQLQVIKEFSTNPLSAISNLVSSVVTGAFNSSWTAWYQVLQLPYRFDLTKSQPAIFWLVVFLAGIFTLFFLGKLDSTNPGKNQAGENGGNWGWQFVSVGVIALLAGGIPFWAAGLSISPVFPWDRFTLPMMLGVSLVLVGIIEALGKTRLHKIGMVTLAVALATGSNFQLSRDFHLEWLSIHDFFWQLTWRAPGLKPGTIILTHELPLEYYSETSLTAPLNWIYAPEIHSGTFNYFVYFSNDVLGAELITLPPGISISRTLRTAEFNSSTSQILAIYYGPPACLHVLDLYGETQPLMPPELRSAIPISNTDQILTENGMKLSLPADLFGTEPPHDWCYFYEKAELARQLGDWNTVVSLGDQVEKLSLNPFWQSEWLPFIEGYVHVGNWDKAEKLTLAGLSAYPLMASGACETWLRISKTTNPDPAQLDIINQVIKATNCS